MHPRIPEQPRDNQSPGTIRDRLDRQERMLRGFRAEVDALRARLDFLTRLAGIDPDDVDLGAGPPR